MARTTNFFVGANSGDGFQNLFDRLVDVEDTYDFLVLKGGPGVGKSTFMRILGETMEQAGTAVALHGEKALAVSLMAMRQLAIMLLMALRYRLISQAAITARVATLVARVAMIINMSPLQQDKVTP